MYIPKSSWFFRNYDPLQFAEWELRIRGNPWQQIQNMLKAQCQRPIWHQCHKAHQNHNHNHKAHLRYPLVLCVPFFPRPTKESSLIPPSPIPTPPTSKSALLLNNFTPGHFIEVHYTTCQKHLLYRYLYACLSVFLNNVGLILGGSMLLFCRAEKLGSRKNLFVFRKQVKFKP